MVRTPIAVARRAIVSYTVSEAAAAAGVDKSTVRTGRISGTRNDVGVRHVEPVELHRAFPASGRPEGDTTAVPRDTTSRAFPKFESWGSRFGRIL
jgi:hypothetical protein